jgi:hypothetical protein
LYPLRKTCDRCGFIHLEKKEKTMAKYWINDEDETKLLSKYMVNDKHYGMWAIQIQDNKHEFHVVTEKGQVLGSKLCTLKGPVYSLFDGDDVALVHVAPHLVFDDLSDLDAWNKGNPESTTGRSVELKEFRLFILDYGKNKGDAYCCSAKKAETRKWW